jgi:rhamnose transport system permease protein
MHLLKQREIQLLLVAIVAGLLISTALPRFRLAPANLGNVYNDTSILIILALGQMASS